MTAPASQADTLRAAIDDICRTRPHMSPILETLAGLLETEERLTAGLAAPTRLVADPDRLARGAAAPAGLKLDFLAPQLHESLRTMLPVAGAAFPAVQAAAETPWQDRNLAAAARMFLDDDRQGLECLASDWGVDSSLLAFLMEIALRPVLRRLAQDMRNSLPTSVWTRGQCPLCGQAPALSFLSSAHEEANEFLRGGGGQKLLCCGLCGFEWRMNRSVCQSCGNDDPQAMECLRPTDAPGERVDVCNACGTYCPGLDLREFENHPHPRLAQLAGIHLDMLAQERGYQPQAWTVWNTFTPQDDQQGNHA